MKNLRWTINHIEEILLCVLMPAIVLIIVVQVVVRITGQSLSWSEELARYLLVAITFIGASYGVKSKAHVGVTFFVSLFPQNTQIGLVRINYIICIVFSGLVVIFSLYIIRVQFHYGQLSPAMHIPMGIAYSPIPIGMGLMTLRFTQELINSFGKNPIKEKN